MTRADLTSIVFILDRSGSMASIKQSTIDAFNKFLHGQREGTGTAEVTLVQFDDQYDVVYECMPVRHAPELTEATFQPRATTALLDAMGRTILSTGKRLAALPDAQRPGTVLVVTLTDGYENASREFALDKINGMIREQRDKYGWQFVFLGADQDAIATAAQMGVDAGQALTFGKSDSGTLACMDALNSKVLGMRSARGRGNHQAQVEFDESDRQAAAPKKPRD